MNIKTTTQEIVIPAGDEWIIRVKERAFENMKRYDGCAQVMVDAFMQEWKIYASAPGMMLIIGGVWLLKA